MKELKLDGHAFKRRLKLLHDESYFKEKSLFFVMETVHRMRWVRMKALADYQANKNANRHNAAVACLKRLIEIDKSIPELCDKMGWHVSELEQFFRSKKKISELRDQTDDDFYREYRQIVGEPPKST